MTMVNPKMVPYSTIDTFGIEKYKIIDRNGEVVVEGKVTDMAEVVEGTVKVNISLEHISGGEYTLVVSELVGSAKAEQPLVMRGNWECDFVK